MALMADLVLHYAPDNASLIVRLALEELGVPYDTRLVDRAAQGQRSPAYLRLNPTGLIPVLETPHGALFETGAILLWLADSQAAMAPGPGHPARGDFLKWLFYSSNTLHAGLRTTFYPEKHVGLDASAQAALRATMQSACAANLALLDVEARRAHAWLGAAQPSVLDYYLAALLRWCALYPRGATGWFDLRRYPALWDMADALEHRPATVAAQGAEGLGPTPFTAPRLAQPPEGSAT